MILRNKKVGPVSVHLTREQIYALIYNNRKFTAANADEKRTAVISSMCSRFLDSLSEICYTLYNTPAAYYPKL